MKESFHHLHLRKRIYKNLEEYPHSDTFKRYFDKGMYFVAMIAPLFLLPQVYQIIILKKTDGISVITWFLFGIVDILWIFYAVMHRERPILIANILLAILNFTVVIGVFLYR